MTRGGRKKDGDGPERRCLVTGQSGDTARLVRFAVGPDDVVVPDVLGRLPGRGLWVAADRGTIERAVSKRAFSRGARRQVVAPPDLADSVEALLVERLVGLIAMARKAGEAVCGYEKVKSWLLAGEAAVLLQASDGSQRGRAKLKPPAGQGSLVTALRASELAVAFGRENVIHGALSAGGLSERVVGEAARLTGLRATDGGERPAGKD